MRDVGIVMPVYNQKLSYLRTAIRSIKRQSYRRFRFVIVIDGANSIVRRAIYQEVAKDPRVKVLVNEQNQGVAQALNRGFDYLKPKSKIKYLTWVSSDNIYGYHFIARLRRALRQGPPQLGLVYSSFRHINHKGKSVFDKSYMKEFRRWQRQPKENLLDNCFVGASFMYKKEYALLAGNYEMEPVEDYDYWLKLTDHCDVKYVPIDLMGYRIRSPYSISAQLQNSVDQHRRWRYSYQLAKHNARTRRGIPFETTVIFIVKDGSQHTLSQFEAMLEQYYSNYKLLVVDISPNTEGIPVLQQVSDPRVSFIEMPSIDENTAIQSKMDQMDTPFTMLYGELPMTGGFYMFELAKLLRESTPDVAGVFYGNQGEILYQHGDPSNAYVFNRLYRSDQLRNMLTTN